MELFPCFSNEITRSSVYSLVCCRVYAELQALNKSTSARSRALHATLVTRIINFWLLLNLTTQSFLSVRFLVSNLLCLANGQGKKELRLGLRQPNRQSNELVLALERE